MKLSEFWRLMRDEFGESYAPSLASSHVLSDAGGASLTIEQHLERGDEPAHVWRRVCEEFSIPDERQWGRDRPPKPSPR